MREVDNVCQLDSVALARAEAGSRPFSDAIHCENCRLVESGREKSTGGVGFVMFDEDIPAFVPSLQGLVHFPRQM